MTTKIPYADALVILERIREVIDPWPSAWLRKKMRVQFVRAVEGVADDFDLILPHADALPRRMYSAVRRAMGDALPERYEPLGKRGYTTSTIEEREEKRAREAEIRRARYEKFRAEANERTDERRRIRAEERDRIRRLRDEEEAEQEKMKRELNDPANEERIKFERRLSKKEDARRARLRGYGQMLYADIGQGLPEETIRQIEDAVPSTEEEWRALTREAASLVEMYPSLAEQSRLAYIALLLRRYRKDEYDLELQRRLDECVPGTTKTVRQELLQTVGLLVHLNRCLAAELEEAKKKLKKQGFFHSAGDK